MSGVALLFFFCPIVVVVIVVPFNVTTSLWRILLRSDFRRYRCVRGRACIAAGVFFRIQSINARYCVIVYNVMWYTHVFMCEQSGKHRRRVTEWARECIKTKLMCFDKMMSSRIPWLISQWLRLASMCDAKMSRNETDCVRKEGIWAKLSSSQNVPCH